MPFAAGGGGPKWTAPPPLVRGTRGGQVSTQAALRWVVLDNID